MTVPLHPLRAVSAAVVALLLAAAPLATIAQEQPPSPLSPTAPNPTESTVPAVPSASGSADTAPVMPISGTIHPGDHLGISVYGDPSLSNTAIVQSDGTIQYSLIGRVKLEGQTPQQAQQTLQKAFSRYLKHPVVAVAIQQPGLINVLVMGNVKQTGRYQISSGAHVTEAIAAAGGIANINGGFPTVRVLSGDGQLHVSDMQKLLREGDNSQNVAIGNNATVYVTGAETIRVQVIGAVTRPGVVDIFEGDRLDQALARAGTQANAKPDLNKIYITRKDDTGKMVSYEVNLYNALKGGDMRYDPVLQKDDKIYVPEAKQMNAAAMGLIGLLGRLFGF